MKLINKKRGTSMIMSVYWFVILFLVAGTIVYMVSIFYGNPYDVREVETNVLINKIANCLSEEGMLKNDFVEGEQINFLEVCHINFDTNDEEIQYYFEVEFLDFESNQIKYSSITGGNINLKDNLNKNSIFSNSKSFYVLKVKDGDETVETQEEIIVKILSVVSKTKKNDG